jgi:hypothetical protein
MRYILSMKDIWQVIFLELDDNSYLAFCPYTKLWAHGHTIDDAKSNWNMKMNNLIITEPITLRIRIYMPCVDSFTFFECTPDEFEIEVPRDGDRCPKIVDVSRRLSMDFKFYCTTIKST